MPRLQLASILVVMTSVMPAAFAAQVQRETPSVETRLAPVVMHPAAVRDAEMGIARSHELLLPDGWTMAGAPHWTPNETAISHLQLDLTAPNGSGVTFFRGGVAPATETNLPITVEAESLPLNATLGDVAVSEILKRKRPSARHIRVLGVSRVKSLASLYEQLVCTSAQQIERQGTWQSFGGDRSTTKVQLDVPLVHVSYREGGRRWEEEIMFYLMAIETQYDSGLGGQTATKQWSYASPVSIRAPKGELEASRPLLYAVMSSVRPTEEWCVRRHVMNVTVARMRHRAAMLSLDAVRKSAERVARSDSQVREQAATSWRQQQATRDSSAQAMVDAFTGVELYRNPDGSTQVLDAGYKRVFTDQDGTILLTNDVLHDPSVGSDVEWKQLERITR